MDFLGLWGWELVEGGIVGNTGVRDKDNKFSMCGGKCW